MIAEVPSDRIGEFQLLLESVLVAKKTTFCPFSQNPTSIEISGIYNK
ncbi:MAG: hypothetical protein V7K44_08630 [Nostoc sp.]